MKLRGDVDGDLAVVALELGRVRERNCGAVGEGVDGDSGSGGYRVEGYEGRERGVGEGGRVGLALREE